MTAVAVEELMRWQDAMVVMGVVIGVVMGAVMGVVRGAEVASAGVASAEVAMAEVASAEMAMGLTADDVDHLDWDDGEIRCHRCNCLQDGHHNYNRCNSCLPRFRRAGVSTDFRPRRRWLLLRRW